MNRKTFIGMLVAAQTALALASCGSAQTPPAGSGATAHNDADVAFTQGVIRHHRQAVEMAGPAAGRNQNPRVLDLAVRIGGEQSQEIQTMTGWLQRWGGELPPDGGLSGRRGSAK